MLFYPKNNETKTDVALFKLSIFCFAVFVLSVSYVHAQILSSNNIELEFTPLSPKSYSEVLLNLQSSEIDLNRSLISWYVNGEQISSDIGLIDFKTITEGVGRILTIEAVIKTNKEREYRKRVVFSPNDLNIVWTAHTYTPPFYKGKALLTSESLIKFTAIASLMDNGERLEPSELVYTWGQDGIVFGRASGVGKDTIVLRGKPLTLGRTTISVIVSSFSKSVSIQETTSVRTQDPNTIFYKKHPLEGILLENAIPKEYNLNEDEILVRAEPYFFAIDDLIGNELFYQWSLNGNNTQTNGNENEIVLRREGGSESGKAEINIKIDNFNKLLQEAQKKFFINF